MFLNGEFGLAGYSLIRRRKGSNARPKRASLRRFPFWQNNRAAHPDQFSKLRRLSWNIQEILNLSETLRYSSCSRRS